MHRTAAACTWGSGCCARHRQHPDCTRLLHKLNRNRSLSFGEKVALAAAGLLGPAENAVPLSLHYRNNSDFALQLKARHGGQEWLSYVAHQQSKLAKAEQEPHGVRRDSILQLS